MKKNSIVLKLFITFTLVVSLFLGAFMMGQTLFFEKFYSYNKTAVLKKNLDKFALTYVKETWNDKEIIQRINQFTDSNNSQIAILDAYGFLKYMPTYDLVLETSDHKEIKIPLNNIVYINDFQSLKLTTNSEIEISGFFSEDLKHIGLIESIKNEHVKWENTYAEEPVVGALPSVQISEKVFKIKGKTEAGQDTLAIKQGIIAQPIRIEAANTIQTADVISLNFMQLKGKVKELNIPDKIEQAAGYNNDALWHAIAYWTWQVKSGNMKVMPEGITSFQYQGNTGSAVNNVFVKPITKGSEITEYLFVISSLQPVGEAVEAMKIYYLYAFFIAVFIILGMSLAFSRVISRPLISMNRIAAKMADLDFSEECEVRTKDELGTLAKNLNQLSSNLGMSLSQLKAANEQLQLDIEKERNLEKMRKEFVSSVSHEFKTPLGIIKSFAEGIKDNIAEKKRDYYIGVILDEIDKMDDLVIDLLELARYESKMQKLNREVFDIRELVDEVANRLSKSADEKNVKINFKFGAVSTYVYGDRRRIEQVITNLLSNAIRHASLDKLVEIGAAAEEDMLIVSIENSGECISEADLLKIWDRFYRIEKSRGRKTGGTGLGLAIVKNILELHESDFGAVNTDKGIKFYFSLKQSETDSNGTQPKDI